MADWSLLIDTFGALRGWLETLQAQQHKMSDEEKKAMSDFYTALNETRIYFGRLSKSLSRDSTIEAQLSRFWMSAATQLRLINLELAKQCFSNAAFWANPGEEWSSENIHRAIEQLNKILCDTEEFLLEKGLRKPSKLVLGFKLSSVIIILISIIGGATGIVEIVQLISEEIKGIRKEVHDINERTQAEEISSQAKREASNSIASVQQLIQKIETLRRDLESSGSQTTLAALQNKFLQLTAGKNDLESRKQAIDQARAEIFNELNLVHSALAKTDPSASTVNSIQKHISKLQELDRSLELQLRQISSQDQTIQNEIQATQRVIDQNIDRSFKTFQ